MSEEEFALLEGVLHVGMALLEDPILVVLDASSDASYTRMKARRDVEEVNVNVNYLEGLRGAYMDWYERLDYRKVLMSTDERSVDEVVENIRQYCGLVGRP